MYFCRQDSLKAEKLVRRNIAAGLMLIIIVSSLCAIGDAQNHRESFAVTEIRELLEGQVAAWNRRDLEGFMAGYWHSPDLTFFSNTTVTSGWQETLQRYRKRYQGEGRDMGKLEFLDLKIETLGPQAAFVRGRYQLKMANGESTGLFTLALRKTREGWKIIHDHTSS